jgi:hypothetical protein
MRTLFSFTMIAIIFIAMSFTMVDKSDASKIEQISIPTTLGFEDFSISEIKEASFFLKEKGVYHSFINQKEQIVWELQLKDDPEIRQATWNMVAFTGDCELVNLQGGGTNPCPYYRFYMYCHSTGRYYCCDSAWGVFSCNEAPAPY